MMDPLVSVTMALPEALTGWQDVLACPFCLEVATECIRLTHIERDKDCGACACVDCVKNWLNLTETPNLMCPRCRHPLCAANLRETMSLPNPGDPFIHRLIADIPVQCSHCDVRGTMASLLKHNASCMGRHLTKLRDADEAIHVAMCRGRLVSGIQWVDAYVSLHKENPTEAFRYLVRWLAVCEERGIDYVFHHPFRTLLVRIPLVIL